MKWEKGQPHRVAAGIDGILYNLSSIKLKVFKKWGILLFYTTGIIVIEIALQALRVLLAVMVALGLVMVTIDETSRRLGATVSSSHAFSLVL